MTAGAGQARRWSGGGPDGGPGDVVAVAGDVAVVVLLLVVGAWLRWGPLGPSTLWLDDAWVALVHRTDTLQELRFVGFAAPGYAALLKGWLGLVGFSATAAQLPALIAGVLTAPALYTVLRWRSVHRAAALLAGGVLVASPIAVVYATRVKQYTLEGLVAVGLLALAVRLLASPRDDRRWAAFVVAGGIGTVVSAFLAPYVAAGVAAVAVVALRRRDRVALVRAVAWGAGYGMAALAWYLGVLRPAVTGAIANFWTDGFLAVGEGVGPLVRSVGAALGAVAAGFAPVPAAATWVVLVGCAVLLVLDARPSREGWAVLAVVPLVVGVVLAGLQLAPLGGGRTDLYLYPSLALLLAGGVDAGLVRLSGDVARRRGAAMVASLVVVVGAVAVVGVAEPAPAYPRFDVAPLVVEADVLAGPDDAVLVYPATVWAYALYTAGESSLVADPVSSWGFSPRFDDPRVVVLPPGRDDPGAYLPTVDALRVGPADVVWFVASHWREDIEVLHELLEEAGFAGEEVDRRDGARLERWERG